MEHFSLFNLGRPVCLTFAQFNGLKILKIQFLFLIVFIDLYMYVDD